ncbi:MAG: hypothetical protein AB4038_05245 [Prochloraceae cyanobacterium]
MNKKNFEEGFTLAEVLLGILTVSLFLSSSLQLMLASTMMRVKANQRSETTDWIREEIEGVRLVAANLAYDSTQPENCGNYGKVLREKLSKETGSGTKIFLSPSKNFGGRDIWLERTMTDNGDSLKLTYRAVEEDASSPGSPGNKVIADFYTEVIPYAVFSCE